MPDTAKRSSETWPKVLFLAGVDGSGKSLLARSLVDRLKAEGVRAQRGFSRHGNFLSRPLLAAALVAGLSRREYRDGERFQYYEFWRAPRFARFYVRMQEMDIVIANHLRIGRPARSVDTLVCDRGPYDTLVDVMLGTRIDLLRDERWRRFLRLVPSAHRVVLLRRPREQVLASRPTLIHDRSWTRKAELYDDLQRHFGWPVVMNSAEPDSAVSRILDAVLGVRSA